MAQIMTATPGMRFQLPAGKRTMKQYQILVIDYDKGTVTAEDMDDYGVPGYRPTMPFTFADFTRRTQIPVQQPPATNQ
jgi:hypothetical protein